jgi:CelD/BcsL family acetyltransferase involved in cellulose biosynthesis
VEAAEPAWRELEAVCPASGYQTRRWLAPWIDTVGRANGGDLMFVVGHDKQGAPVAFLPFGVTAHRRLRIAGFLGARDSNANLGLFRPGCALLRDDVAFLLRAAARQCERRPDLYVLANQPETWEDRRNPMRELGGQPSPSFSHATRLSPDFPAYLAARLSNDTRKKYGKKRKRLAREAGEIIHRVAGDREEARRMLDAFFAQKIARFEQMGIDSEFSRPPTRAFIERLSLDGLDAGTPTLELHGLLAGQRILAVYGGMRCRDRFHAMLNAFDMDEEIARSSPGDLLLMNMLENLGARGVTQFDLGIGEARYKETWCEITEPLFDSVIPVTVKGRAFALAEATRLRLKRQVKQNPWLWSLARRFRKAMHGAA